MSVQYEMVIGLEIHVELKTATKIFCSCPNEFGGEANTKVCPVCLGLPGVLPVFNKRVLEYAVKAGLALNCEIASFSKFDRKNYYYPDLPKNYQVSQYDLPICKGGAVEIDADGVAKTIGITRIHMEEDAGKLLHGGATITSSDYSLVDLNRTGVPLIEIVSEPDMRSAKEARAYIEKVKAILEYIDVSDVKMEQGSLRCDANISLRPVGRKELGVKTEIKNMNSFRSLQRAIEFEEKRQAEVLSAGGRIMQETRSWDENKGITVSLRTKEEAHDYRYLPEPDLVPLVVDPAWVNELKVNLPELPDARRKRLVNQLGLPEYDAGVITASRALADYFDEALQLYNEPKTIANWLMGELLRLLNANNLEINQNKVKPEQLAALLRLQDAGTISGKIAKTVFEEMFATGRDPAEIVREKGLVQISDEGALKEAVAKVIAANPRSVEDYKAGKEKASGFLVGQVMKETRGQANPALVNKLLLEQLQ
ncbi:MAG: Asp-tRNA(Asn)/Glu-tRNA(Gln) amidotransferase subunit GatB [Clostridia bacterium]|jgi:aspartyl-tRNA(Asn)/glutamyl-tRNA(Gln) amidotransferase subunit B|nr:Asp-tRNA(Asn)/Glu-tRNA(Gln) amidotransferase subunit GatB [Clostridia bacterium]